MKGMWVGYDVGCTMGLTLGHGAWQIDQPSNGSIWNSYSFQPVGQRMGYSFTDLGAEGCCRSLNALLWMKKFCISVKISLNFVPKGSIYNNTALVRIMALNMQQAIIWTNADLIHWCIYVTLGGDELNCLAEDMKSYLLYYYSKLMWNLKLKSFVMPLYALC